MTAEPVLTPIGADDPRWEAFVRARPDASVYHLPAWMPILARTYRFTPAALAVAGLGGELDGVFPLLARRARLTGARLRSLPMVPGGGPLGRTPADRDRLIAAAARAARANGHVLFFRSSVPDLHLAGLGVAAIDGPPLYVMDLPQDQDAWLRERPSRLKRGVKRARKDGVTVRLATSEAELRAFYLLYLDTMRKHKAAPRPYVQLTLARELLGEHFKLFVAEHEGRIVAGGVFHAFNGMLELLYNGSDPDALDHRPNHALYSEVIRWGAEHGFAKLDFGVAWPQAPLGEFKAQWGAVPVPEWVYTTAHPEGEHVRSDGDDEAPATGLAGRVRAVVDDAWDRAPLELTEKLASFSLRRL